MYKASQYASIDELPAVVPVFPLTRALLLPRTVLPLNIFEPRYLCMVNHAVAGDRIIGIVQPLPGDDTPQAAPGSPHGSPPLCAVGCAGRISAFVETDDGRIEIQLSGIARFQLGEERTPAGQPFRSFAVDFTAYSRDLDPQARGAQAVDRGALVAALRDFLAAHELTADWDEVDAADTETLVNTLSMIAPFRPIDKQALLEADSLARRAEILVALTRMTLAASTGQQSSTLQ